MRLNSLMIFNMEKLMLTNKLKLLKMFTKL